MVRLLVTGSGFLGKPLIFRLGLIQECSVLAVSRSFNFLLPSPVTYKTIDGIESFSAWNEIIENIEVVIHTAARVHVMDDNAASPLAEFRKVNVEGTLNLARQAAQAGVKRFIFISSIKVNGEGTELGKPYSADDVPAPVDPYGISKLEAEQGLLALAAETGMEVTIIRPVLVYGPGVKANFLSMMGWLSKRVPLPFGAIHNKRSMVALDNLVDLIVTCIDHPAAANQVFLVSDDEDLSTTQLLQRTGTALGKPALLLPIPAFLLTTAARMLGKSGVAQRLCGSLQVDIGKTKTLLGWTPPVSVDEALGKTARHFLE
jgi:nucleoside-diphosphate-sugar epimerase